MTPSKIFLYFCLFFIFGIFLNSFLKIPQPLLLAILFLGVLLIFIPLFFKRVAFLIFGFCLIFLFLGILRHRQAEFKILNSELKKYVGEEISLIGIVKAEPDQREKITKLIVEVKGLKEKILITAGKYPQYYYGDKLKITGKLKNPEVFEGFNYRDYLATKGILAEMSFPEIELLAKNQGNFLFKILFSFKNKLKESLNRLISPTQSAILEALLFGEEGNISREWKEKLNLTGTRHITAVSGMNITILTFLILNFLLALGFWRQQAFYFSIILIAFYILMIGAPSSAIRAGIMAFLFLTAQHFGRVSAAPRAISFAATFMLLLNPLLFKSDIGFQLSFLAMMGLIYLQPFFKEKLKILPNFLEMRTNLAATISAQIFTLPILIYNFGNIPLISPISNILILPLLPLITILGFIFSFFGIFWFSLGQILSFPGWLILTYIIKIVDFSSKIPFANLTFKNIHWLFLVISYLILAFLIWRLKEREKLKFLQY